MAWSTISLLAFLLAASYASATTLQEVCKGSPDANVCLETFKPLVSEEFVLKSPQWWRDFDNQQEAAMVGLKHKVSEQRSKLKGQDAAVLDTCVQMFRDSAKLIDQGAKYQGAVAQLAKCTNSLQGRQGAAVQEVMSLAKKASNDCEIISYVLGKSNPQKPK